MAALLPWWAAVVLAVVAYFVIHPFAEVPPPAATTVAEMGQVVTKQLYRTLATFGQYLVPAAFLMGAAVSAVGRAKRKKLLATTAEVATQDAVKSKTWQEFEMLVGEAFRHQGFTVRETAAGADGGVDLELRKDRELYLTSLPTTRFMSCPCSFDCEDKISATLQPDPDRLGSWETIALAIQKSSEAGHHTNHLVE